MSRRRPLRSRFVMVALFCIACLVPPAQAEWLPEGNWITPGAFPHQRTSNLCPDGAGGAYFIWLQYAQDFSSEDAYIQHLDGQGNVAAGWPAIGIALGQGPGLQHPGLVKSDLLGGVFTTWLTNSTGTAARLQRLRADGSVAPGWPSDGIVPLAAEDLCGDGAGGVWGVTTASDARLWMFHYAADGVPAPGWDQLRRVAPATSAQFAPRIHPTPDGGFLLTWSESRAGGRIIALRFLPSGEPHPAWPADGRVVNSIATIQQYVSTAPDGSGGVFVAWSDYRNGMHPQHPYLYQVYAQHVRADGSIDPGWPADGRPVVTGTPVQYNQYAVTLVPDGSGGVHIVWKGATIHDLHVLADGTLPPGWPATGLYVTPDTEQVWWLPSVADGLGGVYILSSPSEGSTVLAHHLTGSGSHAPGWSSSGRIVAQGSTGSYRQKVAIADGQGGFVVGFYHGTSTSSRILAQRVTADVPVPTAIAFVDAEVEPGRVRLRWSTSDAPSTDAGVERRDAEGAWAERGRARSVGDALLEFEEDGLDAGRYDYRLAVREDGTVAYRGETTLEVPGGFPLELAGFRPNPVSGPPAVAFTLPADGAVRIDVHDVRGRLVASRNLFSTGGPNRVNLGAADWSPGVYWIRLEYGGRIRTSRGVVIH